MNVRFWIERIDKLASPRRYTGLGVAGWERRLEVGIGKEHSIPEPCIVGIVPCGETKHRTRIQRGKRRWARPSDAVSVVVCCKPRNRKSVSREDVLDSEGILSARRGGKELWCCGAVVLRCCARTSWRWIFAQFKLWPLLCRYRNPGRNDARLIRREESHFPTCHEIPSPITLRRTKMRFQSIKCRTLSRYLNDDARRAAGFLRPLSHCLI